MRSLSAPLLASLTGVLASCGDEARVAGNGTYIGNGHTSGIVLLPSGKPAAGAWIECEPVGRRPWDDRASGWNTLADSDGRYECTDLPAGGIGIQAFDPATGFARWRLDTSETERSPSRPVDTLAPTGGIRLALPPATTGVVYFEGLTRTVQVRGQSELEIADLPAGWNGAILIVRSTSAPASTLDSGRMVVPGVVDSIGFTRDSALIRVSLAGGLSAPLAQVPVLVRLDAAWSGYAATQPDGSDLRLSLPDGTSLPLTIASWDRQARRGAFWTVLDTVKAPGDSLDLRLSWGLPARTPTRSGAFEASRGWLGAWPLDDTGNTVADRLGLHPGTPVALSPVSGPFGGAARFDGARSLVRMPGSASSALFPAEGGPFTLSCWARLARFSGSLGQVAGSGEFGGRLYYKPFFYGDTNSWFAKDHRNLPETGGRYHWGPADTAKWTHLAMSVVGDSIAFYIDGVRQDSVSAFDRSDSARTAVDFAIGAALDAQGQSKWHFPGDIAEVWMQGVPRSAAWIRVVAANQKPGSPAAKTVGK